MKSIKNEVCNLEDLDIEDIPDNFCRHFLVLYSDHNSDKKYKFIYKSNSLETIINDIKDFRPKFTRYYIEIYELRSRSHKEIQVIYEYGREHVFI